jgi:hypothetical protein
MAPRSIRVTGPTNPPFLITNIPDNVTAESFSRAITAARFPGTSAIVRIKDPSGRLLDPSDPITGTEVSFICERNPMHSMHVFTTFVFWAVHLIPALFWFRGSPSTTCIYMYFLGVVVLLLFGRWLPELRTSFSLSTSSSKFVRGLALCISSFSPYFDDPMLVRDEGDDDFDIDIMGFE